MILRAALAALAALALLAAPAPAQAEPLVIGTSPGFVPYLEYPASGPPTGLDGDLAAELCTRGGWDCRFERMPVADLFPALAAGRVDIVMGGIGPSEARARVAAFTCPHNRVKTHGKFWAAPGAQPSPGGRVAVVGGTLHAAEMARRGYAVQPYDTSPDLARAFVEGRERVLFGAFQLEVDLTAMGADPVELASLEVASAGAIIAVRKGQRARLARLNALLAEISADGTLGALQQRWVRVNQGDVIAECGTVQLSMLRAAE